MPALPAAGVAAGEVLARLERPDRVPVDLRGGEEFANYGKVVGAVHVPHGLL